MKSRELIDQIFEADKGDGAAPKGGEQATVQVTVTGNPKQIQKALKQLAKDKPAGVKVKAGGEEISPDKDAKIDGAKKSEPKSEKKEPKSDDKKAPPAKKDEPKDDDKPDDDKE
jgi:hypothetical protein